MIKEFIEKYEAGKSAIENTFKAGHPESYIDIVKIVIEVLGAKTDYGTPDSGRIHRIDDGDYQGTLLFVIADNTYQPDTYWAVKIGYGSCSGCDTLQSIRNDEDGMPSDAQVKDYMTLALHIVQGLKEVGGEYIV